jgi:hypothetical protein
MEKQDQENSSQGNMFNKIEIGQATASGPCAPAGGAEKAMGQEFGGNTAQAREALQFGRCGDRRNSGGHHRSANAGRISKTR